MALRKDDVKIKCDVLACLVVPGAGNLVSTLMKVNDEPRCPLRRARGGGTRRQAGGPRHEAGVAAGVQEGG